jgi:hypothetical protein
MAKKSSVRYSDFCFGSMKYNKKEARQKYLLCSKKVFGSVNQLDAIAV